MTISETTKDLLFGFLHGGKLWTAASFFAPKPGNSFSKSFRRSTIHLDVESRESKNAFWEKTKTIASDILDQAGRSLESGKRSFISGTKQTGEEELF